MATQYQSRKDSMDDDNTEEKQYSDSPSKDDDDNDENVTPNNKNNFMHQVQQRRKNSFSYTNPNEQSDSPLMDDINNGNNELLDVDEWKYDDDEWKYDNDNLKQPTISTSHSAITPMNFMKRQHTDKLLIHPTKLSRRHSADKVLCKPSFKNTNSVDYLNTMVITLRSKIQTYKTDLKIAGELGQNLYSQNSKKDLLIQQNKQDVNRLQALNDELSNIKNQLVQTTKLDAEHTKRLEVDLVRQKSTHLLSKSKYKEECERIREVLRHNISDMKQLQQLTERQRLEIEALETRNEQISQNAGETIDDLSCELAEEKDGHSNLKHKYQKLRQQFTKLKIDYEKRGTEINNLKKELHTKELQIFENNDKYTSSFSNDLMSIDKQKEIRLLFRKIDNYKDEIQGMQKHVDLTKNYLKTTINYLENTSLLMKTPDIDQIYALCKNARQFLGINKPPPDPVYEESPEPAPELPKERSAEPLPADDIYSPSMPREPTPPPPKVSQREIQPLSVPAPPKTPTPPPIHPPSLPPTTQLPSTPHELPPPKTKITNKPSLPPSIPPSIPSAPNKPSLPLPPKTHTNTKSKVYTTGRMPDNIHPSLPAPISPNNPTHMYTAPALPNEVIPTPKTKRFSSAMQPTQVTNIRNPIIPSKPMSIPSIPSTPHELPPPKTKITNKPSLPPSIPPSVPSAPKRRSLPLPPPKTHTNIKSKVYTTARMPDNIHPSLHVPISPNNPTHMFTAPALPNEVIPIPKTKRFSSAMQPTQVTNICNPSIPSTPNELPPKTKISAKPSLPPSIPPSIPPSKPISMPSQPPMMPIISKPKLKISAHAMMPGIVEEKQSQIRPSMPRYRDGNNNYILPSVVEREIIPKGKTYNLGVMPAQIVDEKPLSVPSIPNQPNVYNRIPKLPTKQEMKKEVKIVNKVMSPPILAPSLPNEPSNDEFVPSPHMDGRMKMEAVTTRVEENNIKPKRKKTSKPRKKKNKKARKERDSMEEQKQHLTVFFSTYSDSQNWKEGGKENGVQKYILQFAEREPLNARMAFLYSMTLYLGQIVGVNKRCISHAFMLFKSVRAQIDTLCEEFSLILQTLEHHNDDKLWKYVYSFLYNAAAYFKHIQRFVGTRTSVVNSKKYHKHLQSMSRNESITFRKLSGNSIITSDLSGYSRIPSDIGVRDKTHQIYGNIGGVRNNNIPNNNKKRGKQKQ